VGPNPTEPANYSASPTKPLKRN